MADHVKMQCHVKQLITKKTNYVIPDYSCGDDQSDGIHPVCQSLLSPRILKINGSLNASSRDKVANMEAMIISSVCEKRLPLSLTGILWHFHESSLEIQKLFYKVKLKRTAAQYKLQFGVAKTLEESMLREITLHTSHEILMKQLVVIVIEYWQS